MSEEGPKNKFSTGKPGDLVVFITTQESACDECGAKLGNHAWISLKEDRKAVCLSCADYDHLVYLPSGDTALTRRSRKYSSLSVVVVKWSRARKRYERQGVLVEDEALERAERECEGDAQVRDVRRAQAELRRAELDQTYIAQFTVRVRELFPCCPEGRERLIAEHACRKYSGRVGRSAAAKALSEDAVRLAVIAHIRHAETEYDNLLTGGLARREARARVHSKISRYLDAWSRGLTA
ncbi:MAG TPA: DUF2293 domain-containing protein [Verrucomicrobia bacterium]|nr:MAG: hypothetical protein A2X46_08005 [Lentisphaerae bacterium GWF2_57_35]HBA84607.1 DUF2293 domain-containing protein [Verrucomicrobiota bacterium]